MDTTTIRERTADVVVPSVGGKVQVRRIPPAMQQRIHAKATKGGTLDFQELMVWKLAYGVKNPNLTQAQWRELTRRFSMRTLGPIIDKIDELSGTDEHLRCVDDGVPQRLRRYAEQMVMATAWLKRFPDTPSRVPRTTRARGAGRPAGRGASRRSSARSGDSGDDSDSSSDSSEPAKRRLCAFCGKDIPAERSPRATHCSDRHADRDRQRRKRQRDRARSKLPPTPTTADFRRMLEITDEQRDWLRALVDCRCNGRHQEFDPGECFRCGHRLPREQVAA